MKAVELDKSELAMKCNQYGILKCPVCGILTPNSSCPGCFTQIDKLKDFEKHKRILYVRKGYDINKFRTGSWSR